MLPPEDVSVDSYTSQNCLTVGSKQRKTNPFRAGVTIHMGIMDDILCPVRAIVGYLEIRRAIPGPPFLFKDAEPSPDLVSSSQYNRPYARLGWTTRDRSSGHSFRICAATMAAKAELNDSLTKMLGRRKLSAFSAYIRTPWQRVVTVSAALVTSPIHMDNRKTI